MFSINVNQGVTVKHGVHHDNPNTTVSNLLKADLPDSNKMIEKMFKPQIDAMNRRIQCFNHEKRVLKELDLFVLDTSLQEAPCYQNDFTLEKKWKIYNEVKATGIKNIVVASFPCAKYYTKAFLQSLIEKGENMSNNFAIVDCVDVDSSTKAPKNQTSLGLQNCKQFGIKNVVLQLDLVFNGIDYGKFNASKMFDHLSKQFRWIRSNLCGQARIFVNIRDFSESMKRFPARVFCLVNFLSALPASERIFGICFEDGGKFYSEQMAVWTCSVREEMKRFGWYSGHLLINIREQYGLSSGTTLDCLADGATGIWSGLTDEGSALGQTSSCLTIMNLIRVGNKRVLENYKCYALRKASRNIMKITTGNPPHAKQPVTGDRAFDIDFNFFEDMNIIGEDDEDADYGSVIQITYDSSPRKVVTKLKHLFGDEQGFSTRRAEAMIDIMLHDSHEKLSVDYDSKFGLALLYMRSGGETTAAMKEVIEKVNKQKEQFKILRDAIRLMWDNSEGDKSMKDMNKIDFCCFYQSFMSPYFAHSKENQVIKAMEAISLCKNGTVKWDDFYQHVQWTMHQYPDNKSMNDLLKMVFRRRIFPLMKARSHDDDYQKMQDDDYYMDYHFKHDVFFTTNQLGQEEEIVITETSEVHTEINQNAFLEDFQDKITYEVSLKTGEVPDSMFIELIGDRNFTVKIPLTDLKCNKENMFEVQGIDVGEISSVRIGRKEGTNVRCVLYEIVLKVPSRNATFYFEGKILEKDVSFLDLNSYGSLTSTEDDFEIITATDGYMGGNKITYNIRLSTGSVPGVETNSSAYIILYGDKGFTEKLLLRRLKEKTENIFLYDAKDVGNINRIRVGHEMGTDCVVWYLDTVIIEVLKRSTTVKFDAGRWIGTKSSSLSTQEVELYPNTEETINYAITIRTGGKQKGQIIQSDAYIILFGDKATTGKFPIGKLKEDDRNALNIETIDVGKIKDIRIGHEPGCDVAFWHLVDVQIQTSGGDSYTIAANRLIGSKDGRGVLDCNLSPNEEGDNIQYDVSLTVGDVAESCHEFDAYINIIGEDDRETGKCVLSGLKGNSSNSFTVEATDIGDLSKIRIGHDGMKDVPHWYLIKVEVSVVIHGYKNVFRANKQLGGKNGSLDVDLYSNDKAFGNEVSYEFRVQTGDVPDEKQDAYAFIEVFGLKGSTGKLRLKRFKKNKDNLFKMTAYDVGKITYIRIGHEANAEYKSWHLSEVTVNVPERKSTCNFSACRRLGTKGEDWVRDISLFPDTDHHAMIEEIIEEPMIMISNPFQGYKVQYVLHITTGQVPDCEKKSNGYISLLGERGFTGKLQLRKLEEYTKNTFTLEAEDVGKIVKIRVGHDALEDRPCWHLKDVSIEIPVYGSSVSFHADRWLGTKGNYPYTLDMDLYPKGKVKNMKYDVTIKIGGDDPLKRCGRNSFIEIYGKRETGKYPMKFLKENQNNTFSFDAPDVGTVSSIRIGHEYQGFSIEPWNICSVELKKSDQTKALQFNTDKWLGTESTNCSLDVTLYPEEKGVGYWVTIETGAVTLSGVDTSYINIIGKNKKQTGKLPLPPVQGNYSNKAVVQGIDVGQIDTIRIGHISNKDIAYWQVNSIDISTAEDGEKIHCTANKDLGKNGTLEVDVHPDNVKTAEYEICLKTKEVPDENENPFAYIDLFGCLGETGKLPICSIKSNTTNTYKINAKDVGDISYLRFGHEMHASFNTWYLKGITVKKPSCSKLSFVAKQNISSKDDGNAFDVALFPKKTDVEMDFDFESDLMELLVEELIPEPSSIPMFDWKVNYEVHLVTGEVPDQKLAKSSPYIILCGEQGFTGKLPLKGLKQNQDNVFMLEAEEIGKIFKIRIGIDPQAACSCWCLNSVSIKVPIYNSKVSFEADRWIGTQGLQPWTTEVDLYPSGKDAKMADYDINVETGGDITSHVDENAFIMLFGTRGETGKFPLGRLKSKYSTHVNIHAIDIGELKSIRVGHEEGSNVTRWHLERIQIIISGEETTNVNVPADRWIGTKGGPCTLDVDLYPESEGEIIQYELFMKEKDLNLEKCNPYMIIFGEERSSGKLALFDLEKTKGNGYRFVLQAIDVGAVTKLSVGHNGFKNWFLKEVLMKVSAHGSKILFPADRKLGTKVLEGALDVTLFPKEKSFNLCYEIYVKTGCVPDEKQLANAYIEVQGTKGDTGKLSLEMLKDNFDNLFRFTSIDIGKIVCIRVGHESNAEYKSWRLLEVSVNVQRRGLKEYFPANVNLGTMGDECVRDIELYPEVKEVDEELILIKEEIIEPVLFEDYFKVKYVVSLVTGEVPDAKYNANAYIILMGERGFTGKLPLKQLKDNTTSKFELEAEEVGKLLKIRIGHDVMADRTCWYLKEAYVEVPLYGSKVTFPADRWVGTKGEHLCTYDVDLYPKRKAKTIRYEFQVRTGGSNAGKHIKENIYVMIFGDKGETGKYPVERLKKKSQKNFFIDAIDVGKINSIRIGHEPGKDIDCWYLAEVVLSTPHNEIWNRFTVNRWIGTKGANCTLDVELTPVEDVNIQYQIELETGEIDHMGNDANAFMNIFGDKKQTGKLPLANLKDNTKNRTILQAIDVGEIRKIRIGHESNDGISEWYIGKVDIRVAAHESYYRFTAYRGLGGDGVFDMDLYPDDEEREHKIDYDVRITTGDVTEEGKNSNAYVIISGRNGETGKLPLKGMNSFSDNTNLLDAVDVGKISYIRVGHEINADISNWHLDSVQIRRVDRPTLYFPAVCNLGTKGSDPKYEVYLFPTKEVPAEAEIKPTIKDDLFQESGSFFDENDGKVEYNISLTTGIVPSDGGRPYFILFGENGESDKIKVQSIEEEQTSTVTCRCADLGTLTKIRVGQDCKANRKCWHLQGLSVQMPENRPAIKFSADRWIGTKGTYSWTQDADLFPEDKAFEQEYEIKIKTGGKLPGKLINGHAYIILYGSKNSSGKIPVDRLKQSEVTTLKVNSCDLGKLTCVRIGHETGSNVNCWYLLGIAVTDKEQNISIFPANRWIGTKGGSCTLDADIFVRESEMRKYVVNLKTGDIPAGCIEPNTYINIFGQKKNTGKLPLRVIRANDTHTATLMSLDVGPIKKIRIGHEQPRIFTTWHLDAVHIEVPAQKESLTFIADRQIGGYGTLDVDLYPEDAGKYVEYQFYIKTKDVPDEDEHANLFIILQGENLDTGKLPIKSLKSNYDNYETIRAIDVGQIQYIRFGHECTANYKAWQLCEIVVVVNGSRHYFSINRILGTKGEKWDLDITAYPTKEVKINEFMSKPLQDEIVVPDMSDMVPLMDDQDEDEIYEGEAPVVESMNEEDYLKKLDQVDEEAVEVAEEEIIQPDESAVVESAGNEEEYLAMLDEPDVNVKTKVLENTTYLITVKTGDIGGAGTDANVYLTLYGNDGHSGKITLDCEKTELQNIFGRNHEDSFTVVAPDVGYISKIRIGHDNSGSYSKWYLETLQIEVPSREETYKFTASRWLSKTDGDKQTEINLYPSAYHKVEATTYVITVKTGDCYGAGTDANVIVQLFGEKGQSEEISLNMKCLIFGEYIFERSSLDMFLVQATDVGQIKSLRIAHDNEGGYAGWYLDWVGVRAHDYDIKCVADRWLDQYTGDKQLDITIHPSKNLDKSHAIQRMSSNVLKGATRIYDIYVKTGDVMWAGTDAVVYITLYGENGTTNKIILEKSKSYNKPFERKQNDVFTVEALDVGDISKVRIGHDGTGVGAGWYIEGVCITAPGTKFIWTFVAKRWLDVSSGDKQLECDIFPIKTSIS